MPTQPIPDYADTMSIKEFYEACQLNGFIDSDGTGYFLVGGMMSQVQAIPSLICNDTLEQLESVFDGVAWFNK